MRTKLRKILPGIGSIFSQDYSRTDAVKQALADLAKNGPALEFVSSEGWRSLLQEYRRQQADLNAHIVFLSQDATKNAKEMQKNSDFINCFEIIINATNTIVVNHLESLKDLNKNQTEKETQ